jgi:hypothetical protein
VEEHARHVRRPSPGSSRARGTRSSTAAGGLRPSRVSRRLNFTCMNNLAFAPAILGNTVGRRSRRVGVPLSRTCRWQPAARGRLPATRPSTSSTADGERDRSVALTHRDLAAVPLHRLPTRTFQHICGRVRRERRRLPQLPAAWSARPAAKDFIVAHPSADVGARRRLRPRRLRVPGPEVPAASPLYAPRSLLAGAAGERLSAELTLDVVVGDPTEPEDVRRRRPSTPAARKHASRWAGRAAEGASSSAAEHRRLDRLVRRPDRARGRATRTRFSPRSCSRRC